MCVSNIADLTRKFRQNKTPRDTLAASWPYRGPIEDAEESSKFASAAPPTAVEGLEDKDIKKPSGGRGRDVTTPNPLKREHYDLSDPSENVVFEGQSPKARQTKTLLGKDRSPFEFEYNRGKGFGEDGIKREPSTKPHLFDHKTDDLNPKSTPRRSKQAAAHNLRAKKATPAENDQSSRGGGFATPSPQILQPGGRFPSQSFSDTKVQSLQGDFGDGQFDSSEMQDDAAEPKPFKQPETRPISHDQLVIEVKGIYAGLVLVEAKCIEVDEKQTALAQEKDPAQRRPIKDEQWQSLIALHRQLLNEHHDFFLASQHPSATPNLRKLAAKYSMPARMWRHGIHAFLEVLRHRLPDSLEHMLAFIYIAYSMMALLYETVPTCEDTWIECLGDLGRYRMAIEDDKPRDREVWSGVAWYWYSKASDRNPTVGRLYHHLAILARPFTLEQLSYYTRSLTCETPFTSAKGSILTLFNPALAAREGAFQRVHQLERLMILAHALLFVYPEKSVSEYNNVLKQIRDGSLDHFITQSGNNFKQGGIYLVVSMIAALFDFGATTKTGQPRSLLYRAYEKERISQISLHAATDLPVIDANSNSTKIEVQASMNRELPALEDDDLLASNIILTRASNLTFPSFRMILDQKHWEQGHILPAVHIILIFVWSIAEIPDAIGMLEKRIPWESLCAYANHLARQPGAWTTAMWDSNFPATSAANGRPPPEDYVTRGQLYTREFFPLSWFIDAKVDEEERMLEKASHNEYRRLRILWLMARLCSKGQWICFHAESLFAPTSRTNQLLPFPEDVDDPTDSKMTSAKAQEIDSQDPMEVDSKQPGASLPRPGTMSSVWSEGSSMAPQRTDTNLTSTLGDISTELTPSSPGTLRPTATEEPQDMSMQDLNYDKPPLALIKEGGAQVAVDATWTKPAVKDPGTSPPSKKVITLGDGDAVQIVTGDEIPGEREGL